MTITESARPQTAVQLGIYGYGVLGRLPELNLPAALDLVERTGFDGVEIMSNVAGDAAVLAASPLDVAGVHLFDHELVEPADRTGWVQRAAELGAPRLIVSGTDTDVTPDLAARTVAVLTDLGDRGAAAGVAVLYHAHGHEHRPLSAGGPTYLQVLLDEVDGLGLALDAYWIAHGGLDPAAEFAHRRDRSGYYHLKDDSVAERCAYGTGTVPLGRCLTRARPAPGDWAVLELDAPPADFPELAASFHRIVDGGTDGSASDPH